MVKTLYYSYYDRKNQNHAVFLRFDEAGEMVPADAFKWARIIAMKLWGTVNSYSKVRAKGLPGPAWWFDCSGHAGYVLVAWASKVPTALHCHMIDGMPVWNKEWVRRHPEFKDIAVFAFEENSGWADFEMAFPDVSRWMVFRRERSWAENPTFLDPLNRRESPLSPARTALARSRLASPEEMARLVEERLARAARHQREMALNDCS